MKYLDNVEMSNLLLSALWILFSIPLFLSFSNAFAKDEVKEDCIEIPIIKEIEEIRGDIIIPKEIEVPEIDVIDVTDVTILNTNGFIWETENEFSQAFRMARSLLGPNETFEWKNDLYHTNYMEEISLLTTREQEFSNTLNSEKESK